MLTNIQRLRAIAAILVVIYHTNSAAEKYQFNDNWLGLLQPWGTTGVDVFFVMSGFIMVYTQQRKRSGPLTFMLERFIRIAPLYWLLTSLVLILFVFAPALFNSHDLDITWASSSFVFLTQAITGKMPVLYDGWTLEYEMFFYLVFSLALNIKRLEWTVLASSSAMVLFYLATGKMIVLEFVFGMLLGLIRQHYRKALFTPWLTLPVALLCVYLSGAHGLQSDDHRAWAIGIPAALIVYASIYTKQWPADMLTKLGDASFSIYLVQVFTISGWYKLATKLNAHHLDSSLAIGCISGSVIVGTLTHAWIEKPLTDRASHLKNWFRGMLSPHAYR